MAIMIGLKKMIVTSIMPGKSGIPGFMGWSLVVGVTLAALPVGAANTEELYRTEYGISIFGLTIAKSAMETRVANGVYDLNGRFSSSGIARVFDTTDGTIRVNGRSQNGKAVPSAYDLRYTHGKKSKSTLINFSGGAVKTFENAPPTKKRAPWVETSASDLKGVADPLSVMMIAASGPEDVCARTLHVFDGETRADIKLAYSGVEDFSAKGYSGQAVICTAKFIPISGYQQGKKSLDYLANKSKISISFAALGNSGIYAPVIARIGTQIGTVKLYATRFEKLK